MDLRVGTIFSLIEGSKALQMASQVGDAHVEPSHSPRETRQPTALDFGDLPKEIVE